VASPTQTASVALTGSVSGGTAPFTVQWQTDHGYSGAATVADSLNWTAPGISLVDGTNTITVTAFDANDQTVTQTTTVTLTAPSPAAAPTAATGGPVSICISNPSSAVFTTTSATVNLAGGAGGGAGVTKVTWQTSNGASGTATGTGQWQASSIPVLVGTNTVVVRAWDANGVSAMAAVVVVRN
jgi:hypothetical protein